MIGLDAARAILERAERIVAFSGAGLSAESGVPTFRDAATAGHWTKHDPARLASPEGFAADPDLVLSWYRERRVNVAAVEPNPAHRALARSTITNVTQNVDDLLERAGATNVLHVHGTLTHDRCHAACGHEEAIDLADPPAPRACPDCGAPMRPAVVWFGEMLPAAVWAAAEAAIDSCDALLVVGTAASVYPAASLIDLARRHAGASIVLVNPNPSRADTLADVAIHEKAGVALPALLD